MHLPHVNSEYVFCSTDRTSNRVTLITYSILILILIWLITLKFNQLPEDYEQAFPALKSTPGVQTHI